VFTQVQPLRRISRPDQDNLHGAFSTSIRSKNSAKKPKISRNVPAPRQWIVDHPAHVELQRHHGLSGAVYHQYHDGLPKVEFMGEMPLPFHGIGVLHVEMGPISMVLQLHPPKGPVDNQEFSISRFLPVWLPERYHREGFAQKLLIFQ